ncbi:ABC transporter transmembrane domain-containing protein [Pseudomonas sp. BE134]|uniref:ABC transporter transmembrane domain-containing protein n=1 Tax=Pseudomonas sp. BE134 TaxID=2817843 RepID=UPI00285D5401|nr:ABC transporter transmembrane domain-containing protein [Pseudomonas sp. BE134]MDR6924247.1 ABC-type bacteriocin/lantibiotic exporter with double-glycine peptidase domain [Pseudomonas sp. BE134]
MNSSTAKPSVPVVDDRPRFHRLDVAAVSLVIHLLALALPLALLQIYDRILPSQSYGTAVFLVLGVGIAIILEVILRYGRTALFAHIAAQYESETTTRIFDRLLKADINVVEGMGTANVIDGIRSVAQVRDQWSGNAAVALYEVPFIAVYIGLVAYIGGWLAVIPLTLFAVALGMTLLVKAATERTLGNVEAADSRRRNLLWASFAGLSEVKSRGAEPGLSRNYAVMNARYMEASARLEMLVAWVRENAALLGQLSTVLIVIFGAIDVMKGELSTGGLTACTLLAGRSIGPAMLGLGYLARLAQAREAQAKVQHLLELPVGDAVLYPQKRDETGASLIVTQGCIELLRENNPDLTINIASGELVHLDAADAALASKLLAMVAGTGRQQGLEVRLDGHSVLEYSAVSLRHSVSLVPRHPALVAGSILNNLTLFDPRYNERARDYAEALGLLPFLGRLRSGALTEIGALGAEQFDEGVYQRIALIRALVREPKILLLDHAGSGLDLDGQKRLAALLQNMAGRPTVLVASNKPIMIGACDRSIHIGRSHPHAG